MTRPDGAAGRDREGERERGGDQGREAEKGRGAGEGRARPPSDAAAGGSPDEPVFYCDLCGNVMLNLHCKLICERCGYKRDCSDP